MFRRKRASAGWLCLNGTWKLNTYKEGRWMDVVEFDSRNGHEG